MKRQLAKGFAMLMTLVAVAFVTAVASANGQSQRTRANVPFDFIVGSKSLPSGSYAVDKMTASGATLIIRKSDANDAAVRMTLPLSGTSEQPKLVFHRYGDRYFLAEVWNGEGAGRQLIKSKQEKAIERELASTGSGNESAKARFERVEILAAVQ